MSESSNSVSSYCSTISSISSLSDRLGTHSFDVSNYIPKDTSCASRMLNKFKPTAAKGLYAKLVMKNADVELLVQRLIQSIENDSNKIHDLLQMIPDLLLIDYNITAYSSQEYDQQIGVRLEMAARRQNDIMKCNIVLTHPSHFAKGISNTLDLFLWHLIKQLTSNRQKSPTFQLIMRVFISFLHHLAKTEIDALRLTAHLFAFRLNKHLCVRKIQIATNIVDFDTSARLYDEINCVINKYQLDAIYTGIQHNIHFQALYDEFARYNRICIIADDEQQFTNDRSLNFMAELLEMKRQSMVKHVIESCNVLMQQRHLRHVFESEAFARLVEQLYRRMNHTNNDIAILAATFFRIAFQYRHWALPAADDIISRLTIRSYSKNLRLARHFGEALAIYFGQYDSETIFEMLIKIADMFNDCTHNRVSAIKYAYLVESLHKYLPALEPLEIMRVLIRKLSGATAPTAEYACAMMDIFYHSCCMQYNGKISIERIRDDISVTSDNFTLTRVILTKVSVLGKLATTTHNIMPWVYKTLTLLKYSSPDLYQLKNTLTTVVNDCMELFHDKTINEPLWYSMAGFIESASKMQGGDDYLLTLEGVLFTIAEQYKIHLLAFRKEATNELKIEILCALIKIKTIMMCSVSVKDVDFSLFYCFWADSTLPEEIVREQITCCAHHMKCQVHDMINHRGFLPINADSFRPWKLEARSFWLAMDQLHAQKPEQYFNTIYKAMGIVISNYSLLFTPELRHLVKSSGSPFNYWGTSTEMFNTFWEECVLKNEDAASLPLATRRKYFDIAFQLYYRPQHPNAFSPYIIKLIAYFPKCNTLHKTSYLLFFDQIALDCSDFFYLIVSTLRYYEVDMEEEWVDEDVVELCGILATYLLAKEVLPLLQYFVDFAVDKESYAILKHINLFAEDLPVDEKNKFNKYANRCLPAEHMLTL